MFIALKPGQQCGSLMFFQWFLYNKGGLRHRGILFQALGAHAISINRINTLLVLLFITILILENKTFIRSEYTHEQD